MQDALIAFLEGSDYEDVIRKAIYLGGDADTEAAIAGGIAAAYYGVPDASVTIPQTPQSGLPYPHQRSGDVKDPRSDLGTQTQVRR